jgi:hypothetical protein
VGPLTKSSTYNTTHEDGPSAWEASWEVFNSSSVRVRFAVCSKSGGMAARYRSGYLVSRRRALSHAEALATGERVHLEPVHIPNSFLPLSIHLA